MKKELKGICEALKSGYSLGCWSSGGRVPVVAIMDKKVTVASGEGGVIEESFLDAEKDWKEYLKNMIPFEKRGKSGPSLMTGSNGSSNSSIFGWLDRWVKSGSGYLQADFISYDDIFIVMLDGYNDDIDRVIQLGFDKDLIKAIENASNAPKKLLDA